MTTKPFVSVVMITYNHENYIKEAVESVLMQQCNFNVELIIADDKSPDKTEDVVNKILIDHPNREWVKYHKHIKNKGMMPNFIWALEQCKGKYIALCEGDDYWTDPLKLQKQVDFLEKNNDVIICGTNFNVLKENKIICNNRYKKVEFFNHYDIISDNRASTLTSMFKNNFILPEYFHKCNFGDMSLWLYLTKTFKSYVAVLPVNTSVYRIHSNGVYSGNSQIQNIRNGFNDKLLFLKNNEKDFKFLFYSIKLYIIKGFRELIRAILFRPYSDKRYFPMYLFMIFKMCKTFFKL